MPLCLSTAVLLLRLHGQLPFSPHTPLSEPASVDGKENFASLLILPHPRRAQTPLREQRGMMTRAL